MLTVTTQEELDNVTTTSITIRGSVTLYASQHRFTNVYVHEGDVCYVHDADLDVRIVVHNHANIQFRNHSKYGNGSIFLFDNSSASYVIGATYVSLSGNTNAIVCGKTHVDASDNSFVEVEDSVTVNASRYAEVYASGKATVRAQDYVRVRSTEESTVYGKHMSSVESFGTSNKVAAPTIITDTWHKNLRTSNRIDLSDPMQWCTYNGVFLNDDGITVPLHLRDNTSFYFAAPTHDSVLTHVPVSDLITRNRDCAERKSY